MPNKFNCPQKHTPLYLIELCKLLKLCSQENNTAEKQCLSNALFFLLPKYLTISLKHLKNRNKKVTACTRPLTRRWLQTHMLIDRLLNKTGCKRLTCRFAIK